MLVLDGEIVVDEIRGKVSLAQMPPTFAAAKQDRIRLVLLEPGLRRRSGAQIDDAAIGPEDMITAGFETAGEGGPDHALCRQPRFFDCS